jgi:Bacterial regulatory protein, Fis family
MEIGTTYKQRTDEEYLASIKKHRGNITAVARELDLHRSSVARKLKNSPELQQAVNDERDAFIDLCEDRLLGLVERDSFPAIQYTLKTIGRARGWNEETTINLKNDEDEGDYDLSVLTPDELAELERLNAKIYKPRDASED